MKRPGILMIVAIATLGVANNCLAQSTATASVSASVVTPIGLVKTVDMSFGNAAVSSVSGGSIVLSPVGARTTGGSGVTLPSTAGTVSAASFTVSGAALFTYAISLPSSVTISSGASAMTVSNFTSLPSSAGTLSASGLQTLTVGATLSVAAGQTAGTYTNSTAVPVTVNYN